MNSSVHGKEGSLREQLLSRDGGLDLYSDLDHIAALLADEQGRRRCNIDALLAFLESFDELERNEDTRIKKRSDPAHDALTIVTMHSSKGLEYGIVFALGVAKRSREPERIVPVVTDQGTTVLSPVDDKNSPLYRAYCDELDAEKVRQLYVTLTRARERVYIPVVIAPYSKTAPGRASPLELLLARLHQPPCDDPYSRINGYDGAPLRQLIAATPLLLGVSELDGAHTPVQYPNVSVPLALVPPRVVEVVAPASYLHSFTTLTRQRTTVHGHIDGVPHDFAAHDKTSHTLPAGSATGTLLHTLLELTSFSASTVDTEPHIAGSRYSAWGPCLNAMVDAAFTADLGGFVLRDVDDTQCYRETEFLYPCRGVLPLDERGVDSGYLKGVIDLLFCYQGRYYLLDWKSNWLGPSADSYSVDAMEEAMQQHHYHLQAAVYREAAARYLALVDTRPFDAIFGGTYYLFLRGLAPGSRRGVYLIEEEYG